MSFITGASAISDYLESLYSQTTSLSGQSNINYASAFNNYIYITGNQNIQGVKTFCSGSFTGWVNIGSATVLPDNPLAILGSGNYLQTTIQNNSLSTGSSSDYIATSDIGTDLTGFIDLGINNSKYSDPKYSITTANDGYLFMNGGDIIIGTMTTGKNIKLSVGNTLSSNLVAVIDISGINLSAGNDYRINNVSITGMFQSNDITISGNLTATGTALIARDSTISGMLASQLTNSGQVLYNNIVSTSGFATGASGSLSYILTQTGIQIGVISGAVSTLLTLTGQTLLNNIIAVSGSLTNTGAKLSAIFVTGSSIINQVNFSGLGNLLIFTSGTATFISGGLAGTGAGVSTLNNLQNSVIIIGTGANSITTIGQQLVISGLYNEQYMNYTGIATNPIASMYASGWGNSLYATSLYSRRIKAILPQLTATQQIWGDTASNVGTLTTESSELNGENTRITPTAGLSAGTSYTTASIYRGSQLGIGNGFFFVSKFSLTGNMPGVSPLGGGYGSSGTRLFIGLTDQAVAAQVQLNDPIGNFVGLQYLWASGGAVGTGQYMQNWAITSRNNVSTSTGNTSMSFATGFYRFGMFCPPFPNNGTIFYQLDDLIRGSGIQGTITSTLPVGSTAMRAMVAQGFVSGLWPLGIQCIYTEIPSSRNGIG